MYDVFIILLQTVIKKNRKVLFTPLFFIETNVNKTFLFVQDDKTC